MRLLFTSMMLPYPPTFGKRMEIWSSIQALVAEGHEITLVTFDDSGQADVDLTPVKAVCKHVDLIPIQLSGPASIFSYFGRLASLPLSYPYPAYRFRSHEFERRVASRLASEPYDAIVCGEVFTSQNVPKDTTVPVILKKDHIASTLVERYLQFETNPVKRAYAYLEYKKTYAWESALCRRADAIMSCSEYEEAVLRQMAPSAIITISPNVIDASEYTGDFGPEEPNTILYSGLMDWHPNQDAVLWFLESAFSELRRLIPEVKFVIAGRSTRTAFRDRVNKIPGVDFLGTVPDMRPVIGRAAVCIVPLRIGSGTRFKILEASAMSKPVVSTSLGAEGLLFHDDLDIRIADDPMAFAWKTAELLKDPTRRRAMGAAARAKVISRYSFDALRAGAKQALELTVPQPAMAKAHR